MQSKLEKKYLKLPKICILFCTHNGQIFFKNVNIYDKLAVLKNIESIFEFIYTNIHMFVEHEHTIVHQLDTRGKLNENVQNKLPPNDNYIIYINLQYSQPTK